MDSKGKRVINILINNHNSLIGIRQQIDVIERVLEKLPDWEFKRSEYLIPNQINLMIEENNFEFSKKMFDIKNKYPDTKFLLFVTEYLTTSPFGFQLNSFDFKTKLMHAYIEFFSALKLLNLFSKKDLDGNFYNSSDKEVIYSKINRFLNRLFIAPLKLISDSDALINAIQITRREHFLKKTRFLYDLVFSNHKAVNITYENFFKSEVVLFPTFIDIKKAIKARLRIQEKLKKEFYPGLFFSGRVTSYRKKIIKKLLSFNDGFSKSSVFKYSKRIDKLASRDEEKIPLFEVYIKQEKKWPYSSPMRTLMSIEKGFYPLDIDLFNDNDINKIPIKVKKEDINEILYHITKNTVEEHFNYLDEKIKLHNKTQLELLPEIENAFKTFLK